VPALDGATGALGPGVTVLLGRNGAGKSTLCRLLVGFEQPDSGVVTRDGVALDSIARWKRAHARTGWLPQDVRAPASMTVVQYLRYAAWLKGHPSRDLAGLVDEALARTDLHPQRNRRIGQLSGGMARRVGIARAIVHRPSFVVLDEPTVGLDPEQRAGFHQLITDLGTDHVVLLSTHLLEDACALADDLLVLDAGRIRFAGAVGDLPAGAADPDALRDWFLGIVADAGR
jgi:ABC-2 type transport system ATP-binding protein